MTSTTTLTPYLTLPHLLSLTWLAYPILSLAFIAFRLSASLSSAQSSLGNAKSTLLASCKAAETAATSAASMPRFLAIKTNEQYVDAVNGSLDAARKALVLALTIMEAIINFIIDLYRSTLLCFLELVVRAGLSILIGAVNEINQLLQTISSGLKTSIQSDIQSANSVIQTAIDGINKINPFSDITAPQIPVPNLDALNNVTLPSTINDALTSLNSSLPSVADLKNEVESIIDTPFELVKKEINDTFAGIVLTPDGLPVPERNLISFCGDMDLSLVDDLGKDLIKAAKIGIIIIVVLVLVLIGLNSLLEWYKWRCLKRHMEYTRQAWATDPILIRYPSNGSTQQQHGSPPTMTMSDHNLLILQNTSAHPLITRILNNLSTKFHLSPETHLTMTWFTSYIFHPSALACLLVGLLGLLSIQLQLIALRPLVSTYQSKGQQQVTDFSNTIATAINSSMYNQSSFYSSGINAHVTNLNTQLSSGILGSIENTTIHLNTTIANFYQDVQDGVEKVFGGTILDSPVQEFIKCFLGSKVDAVENVLTFLQREVAIQLPLVNESVLVLQPDQVQELSRPIALAAVGGGDSGSTTGEQGQGEGSLLEKIVQEYVSTLEKERITFFVFLGCWFLVVLMGIAIILWNRRNSRKKGVRVSGFNYDTGTGNLAAAGMNRSGSLADQEGGGNKWLTSLRALASRNRSWRSAGGKEDSGRKTFVSPFRMSVGEDGTLLPWNSKNEKKGFHDRTGSDEQNDSGFGVVEMKNERRGSKTPHNPLTQRELPQFTPMPSPKPQGQLLGGLSRDNSFAVRSVREEGEDFNGADIGGEKEMRMTIGAGWARKFAERFVGRNPSRVNPPKTRESVDSGIGFPAPIATPIADTFSRSNTSLNAINDGGKKKRNTLSKPQPFSSQPREEFLEDVLPTPTLEEGRRGLGFLGRRPSFLRSQAQQQTRPELVQPLVPRRMPPLAASNPIAPLQPALPPSPSPAAAPTRMAMLRNSPPMLRITVNPPSGDFSKSSIGLPMPMKPRSRNTSSESVSYGRQNPFSPPAPVSPPPVVTKGVSPFSPERSVFSPVSASPTQSRFAPPLHHGFNDSRYPTLVGGKESNGPTSISAAAFRSGNDRPGHQKRQSTLMVPTTPGAGDSHRRSWSVPMPPMSATATPTTAGSTMTTSELQRSMLRGLSSSSQEDLPARTRPGLSLDHNSATPSKVIPVNPFDDERKVKIEKPAKTRKSMIPTRTSMKLNPFEVVVEGEEREHW